ncbi:MAG TPA: YdeI/OmpD-associated family protein [Candidatus Limnocylindria bacterium]
MKFSTTIALGGKTATGFQVPDRVVESLGAGKRPAVTVRIGGHTYRSTVATMDGVFMLPLSAANREAAGVAAGAEVEVELTLDTAPRVMAVPDDLAAALDAEPAARGTFDGLSYSLQRFHVESVTGARTDETRQRRIAKAVATLREGRAR